MSEHCSTNPPNINPLHNHGFQFEIMRLPDVSFFAQQVNLPSIGLGSIDFENPLANAPIPGEKIEFGELSVQFIVDEDMANYISVFNWMIGLGFPEDHIQYTNFLRTDPDATTTIGQMDRSSELMKGYSDAVLTILNNNNTASRTIHFVDLFPTNLDALTMDSTVSEATLVTANTTFTYSYFFFE